MKSKVHGCATGYLRRCQLGQVLHLQAALYELAVGFHGCRDKLLTVQAKIVSENECYPSNIGALAGRKGKSWQEREEAFRKGVSGSGVW